MKKILAGLLLLTSAYSYAQENYQFNIDLTKVNNDLLEVKLITPKIDSTTIIYNIPKIVPGTYQVYNFGQYVMDFEAFDADGRALSVNKLDENRWQIDGAKKLSSISYWVEDTWDAEVEDLVFEPGGTNIQEGENIVLNTHGFFGYFDNMKNRKFELNVTRPANFYGSTGLSNVSTTDSTDKYSINNYMDLVDAPIMYNVPDKEIIKVGDTEVLISVYSKNKVVAAKDLIEDIKNILEAQRNYLGGKLPVDKYAFIIYLYEGISGSGGSGALEHSYSSFYYLPEMPAKQLSSFLVRIAAHEFFHIVTPLNIHSEEIGDFDYINPKMSKHLWLYEGITEYFAGHVQVYEGLMTPEKYLEVIEEKVSGANHYKDDLPFTEMSLGCLGEHKDQYGNVYQKGALIGLCLDILLRSESYGEKGVKDLMHQLSQDFGKNKSFKDNDLFDKIETLSSPEIRKFFAKYVDGQMPLPLQAILMKVGITFKKDVKVKEFTLGGISLGFNPESGRLVVMDISNMNAFGKELGYENNDELLSINGIELTNANTQTVFNDLKNKTKEGDYIEVTVARMVKEKEKIKKLKAKAFKVEKTKNYLIEFNQNASKEQIKLRNLWLGINAMEEK